MNHSCRPNIALFFLGSNVKDPRFQNVYFYALRDIEEGDELTFDYNYSNNMDKTLCLCGKRECKKYFFKDV